MRSHKADCLPRLYRTAEYAKMNDNTAVRIVAAVEHQSARFSARIVNGRRNALYNRFEQIVYALSRFCRHKNGRFGIEPQIVFYLLFNRRNVGCRQIDFIDDGNYFEVVLKRQIHIGKRLRFDALRRVDQKQGAFA